MRIGDEGDLPAINPWHVAAHFIAFMTGSFLLACVMIGGCYGFDFLWSLVSCW